MALSLKEKAAALGFRTESGLSEAIVHVKETYWATDNKAQGDNDKMLLHMIGPREDIDTGELMEDKEDHHEKYATGGKISDNTGWESDDNQHLTDIKKNPKRVFHPNSAVGQIIDRIVDEDNPNHIAGLLEALIERHGKPDAFDAATYNNLKLKFERFEQTFETADGKKIVTNKLYPVAFLGWADGWTKGGKAKATTKATAPVKAVPKVDADDDGGPVAALYNALGKAEKVQLQSLAKKSGGDNSKFESGALAIDAVTDDQELIEAVVSGELLAYLTA